MNMRAISDHADIEETIRAYTDGIRAIDHTMILKAFSPLSRLLSSEYDDLYDRLVTTHFNAKWERRVRSDSSHPVNGDFETRILSIDSANTAAQVKLEWRFPAFRYIDYLNLIKKDDRWYIVNKIWDTCPI